MMRFAQRSCVYRIIGMPFVFLVSFSALILAHVRYHLYAKLLRVCRETILNLPRNDLRRCCETVVKLLRHCYGAVAKALRS